MVRVRSTKSAHKRKKRVLKKAKGQFGHRSRRYLQAKRSVMKGMTYAYRDRKVRKREFRSLWIIRLNAACKESGMTYSRFINGLIKAKVVIDRKVLSELAVSSPEVFKKLVEISQAAVTKKASGKTKKTAASSK